LVPTNDFDRNSSTSAARKRVDPAKMATYVEMALGPI
jgi:hypothetical protein